MDYILYEVDGAVGTITINRPKALNALNSQVLEELDATLDAVDLNTVRCLVLTGAGDKSFVAGADIGEMSSLTKAEGETNRNIEYYWNQTLKAIKEKPVEYDNENVHAVTHVEKHIVELDGDVSGCGRSLRTLLLRRGSLHRVSSRS